jgi:hypothetical protein
MARKRTKGDPIQFRLPLDVHAHLVAKAGDRSPAEYLAAIVIADFEKSRS